MTTLRTLIEQHRSGLLRKTVDNLLPHLASHYVLLNTCHYTVPKNFHNIRYDGTYYDLFMPHGLGSSLFCETLMIELARIVHHQETCDARPQLPLYPDKSDTSFNDAYAIALDWMVPPDLLQKSTERNQGLINLIASDFGVSSKYVTQQMKRHSYNITSSPTL